MATAQARVNNTSSKPYAIDFVTPNRTYYVAAKSQEEQLSWIDLFRRFTKAAIDGISLPTTPAPQSPTSGPSPRSPSSSTSTPTAPLTVSDNGSSTPSSSRVSASSNDRASTGSGKLSDKIEDRESHRPAVARVMSAWNLVKSNVERGVLFIQDTITMQFSRKVVEVRGDNLFLYSSEAKVSQRRASSSSIVLTMCQVRPGRLPEQEDATVPGTTEDAIFRVFSLVTPLTTLYFMAQTVPEASRWIRIFQQIQKMTRERARADSLLAAAKAESGTVSPMGVSPRPNFVVSSPRSPSSSSSPSYSATNNSADGASSPNNLQLPSISPHNNDSSRPTSFTSDTTTSTQTSSAAADQASPRLLDSRPSSWNASAPMPSPSSADAPHSPHHAPQQDILTKEIPTIGVEALDPQTRRILELLNRPENRRCADCGDEDPLWASINLGIFICLECSGIHRSLGVHISKVRSVDLDRWDESMADAMAAMGNEKSNANFVAQLPEGKAPNAHTSRAEKEWFIRAKYVFKQFVAGGSGEAAARSAMSAQRASAALASMVYQEGHLSVSSESEKSWKTRWVVLKENRLLFFKARADPEPKTALLLSCAHVKTTTLDRINTFELVVPGDVFYLQADNSSDFFLWMDLIRTSQKLFKSSQAPGTSNTNQLLAPTSVDGIDRTSPRASIMMSSGTSPTAINPLSTSGSSSSGIQEVYRTGWLYKQGQKVKNWKKRWFVLKDNKLTYYAGKNDKVQKGSIALSLAVPKDGAHEGGTSIKGISDHAYAYTFEIVVTGRVYYVAATSDLETKEWVSAIRASKKAHESRVALSLATAKNKDLALSSPGQALDALPDLEKEE